MGEAARMDRCARFVKEFGKDAVRTYGKPFKSVLAPMGLGQHELTQMVFLFGTVVDSKLEEFEVVLPSPIFFDPEESPPDTIERVMDLFDLTKRQATKRLKKAELL